MTNNIYLSTTCFKKDSLEEIINICKDHNISNLELSGNLKYLDDDDLNKLLNDSNFNFRFHNYFPIPKEPFIINIASPQTADLSIKNIIKGMNFANNYGAKIFSFHAGLRFDPIISSLGKKQLVFDTLSLDESYALLEKSLSTIVKSNLYKCTICIENNVIENKNFNKSENRYVFSDLSDYKFIRRIINF